MDRTITLCCNNCEEQCIKEVRYEKTGRYRDKDGIREICCIGCQNGGCIEVTKQMLIERIIELQDYNQYLEKELEDIKKQISYNKYNIVNKSIEFDVNLKDEK